MGLSPGKVPRRNCGAKVVTAKLVCDRCLTRDPGASARLTTLPADGLGSKVNGARSRA